LSCRYAAVVVQPGGAAFNPMWLCVLVSAAMFASLDVLNKAGLRTRVSRYTLHPCVAGGWFAMLSCRGVCKGVSAK
jgi:hypothetical protein